MKTIQKIDALSLSNTVVALGCFDGVHLGHAELFRAARDVAEQKELTFAVYSFREPPKNFFSPQKVPLLTDFENKKKIVRSLGADIFFCPEFDAQIARLSAEEFFCEHLVKKLGARHVVCGFNYRFGKGGEGDVALLSRLCEEQNIGLTIIPEFKLDGQVVSSSEIRKLLAQGDVKKASLFLSRPYSIVGEVVNGQHLGRVLGFPTINQEFSSQSDLLPHGVYATRVKIGRRYHRSITNVGTRPTVDGSTLCAETHLLDYSGDLYGKTLRVEFIDFIRPETKFSSIDGLRAQIARDIEKVRS